ncbi:hypothetical protein [Solidesulfovibrio sp.]|uniref:hypothetical protein n=1 Tax=Solidesulfovibrio sp. TaxID=2910990 RepID=UPI002614BED7|nr:hypothetical protein [Solidesulfovibrio sp.]
MQAVPVQQCDKRTPPLSLEGAPLENVMAAAFLFLSFFLLLCLCPRAAHSQQQGRLEHLSQWLGKAPFEKIQGRTLFNDKAFREAFSSTVGNTLATYFFDAYAGAGRYFHSANIEQNAGVLLVPVSDLSENFSAMMLIDTKQGAIDVCWNGDLSVDGRDTLRIDTLFLHTGEKIPVAENSCDQFTVASLAQARRSGKDSAKEARLVEEKFARYKEDGRRYEARRKEEEARPYADSKFRNDQKSSDLAQCKKMTHAPCDLAQCLEARLGFWKQSAQARLDLLGRNYGANRAALDPVVREHDARNKALLGAWQAQLADANACERRAQALAALASDQKQYTWDLHSLPTDPPKAKSPAAAQQGGMPMAVANPLEGTWVGKFQLINGNGKSYSYVSQYRITADPAKPGLLRFTQVDTLSFLNLNDNFSCSGQNAYTINYEGKIVPEGDKLRFIQKTVSNPACGTPESDYFRLNGESLEAVRVNGGKITKGAWKRS